MTREVKVPSIEIPLDIIKTKRKLRLKITESKFLNEGLNIDINPGGIVGGSERMARDGIVYFGKKNV